MGSVLQESENNIFNSDCFSKLQLISIFLYLQTKYLAQVLACEESLPAEPNRAPLPSDVKSRNYTNASRGIPAAAFPPSLIKWPGLNSNKQKRLVEIKKQVSVNESSFVE
jgi:hypothetical protein